MEISKQLFEDVLSGKLKGTFMLRNKLRIKTKFLMKSNFELLGFLYKLHDLDAICAEYTEYGKASNCAGSNFDIVDFIPDTNMKENELTIEIPDDKVVDWDESKKQNKIVLKYKQLTYENICSALFKDEMMYYTTKNGNINYIPFFESNKENLCDPNNAITEHQLECILAKNKLANVAKYLNNGWKPSCVSDIFLLMETQVGISVFVVANGSCASNCGSIWFKSKELAQQAIKILGEETIKLALEPLGI